jgi:hypothetical protein
VLVLELVPGAGGAPAHYLVALAGLVVVVLELAVVLLTTPGSEGHAAGPRPWAPTAHRCCDLQHQPGHLTRVLVVVVGISSRPSPSQDSTDAGSTISRVQVHAGQCGRAPGCPAALAGLVVLVLVPQTGFRVLLRINQAQGAVPPAAEHPHPLATARPAENQQGPRRSDLEPWTREPSPDLAS